MKVVPTVKNPYTRVHARQEALDEAVRRVYKANIGTAYVLRKMLRPRGKSLEEIYPATIQLIRDEYNKVIQGR